MKIIKQEVPVIALKRSGGKDIILNVNLRDALIRFGVAVLLPIVALLIDVHLVFYTAPLIAYLFTTAIVRFCVVKYLWRRYIAGDRAPAPKGYGKDLNYPEESL